MKSKEYDIELYKDNAGNYHLFALLDGEPVAGFWSTGKLTRDTIVNLLSDDPMDPVDWEGQYSPDDYNGAETTKEAVELAYKWCQDTMAEHSGGCYELDAEEWMRKGD